MFRKLISNARVKKRSQLDIIACILRTILNGGGRATKTEIVYKAGLNFRRAKEYLDLLKRMGFVNESQDKVRKMYLITDKGKSFLADYEKARKP